VLRVAEVERPAPRKGEVSIRIAATAVTASDIIGRALRAPARYRIPARLVMGWNGPRRPIFGMVLAGEIESVGRNVRSYKPGDQVFGLSRWKAGCYAEYVCWSEDALLAARPANLSYEECAALPYGGMLALHLMRKAEIQKGQRVLVYGASGAIGTAAVQLARHYGASVTGVCSTRNLSLVQSLGAEDVVDYTREDYASRGQRYDVILDAVGKKKSAPALLRAPDALAPGGRCISIDDSWPRLLPTDLPLLKRLAESGELRPVIDRRYPLEEIVEAHRYVEEGHKRGNVIVTVGAQDVSSHREQTRRLLTDDPFGGRQPTSHERMTGLPWDASYHDGPAPWDIGRPQPAIVRLASQGAFAGAVLDVGCGTGEHALLVAGLGLPVLGVDVAETALAMAREKARDRGIDVELAVADALHLERLGRMFQTVLDCGLFHAFDAEERPAYVASLASVTEHGGTVYVLCFSDEGPETGPHPVSQEELSAAFNPDNGWNVVAIEAERVQTRFHDDNGAPAWLATVKRI
jgi:NADPH:quinone reductase-like Zn-dependent oxidoreductase/SAM-dependent methyltransferase